MFRHFKNDVNCRQFINFQCIMQMIKIYFFWFVDIETNFGIFLLADK